MEAVKHPAGYWVVQHASGVARPGTFDTEEAANQSMYLTAQKLQSIYVPIRNGGAPLTMEQIMAAFPQPQTST